MASQHDQHQRPVLTASLTTGIALVTRGMSECRDLVDEILRLDHKDWETVLLIGDIEFHQSKAGPYPDQQMRVSARPSSGYAALNHTDNADQQVTIANSYNARRPLPGVYLVFNGETGSVFPPAAVIRIADARNALHEWLATRQRPACIEWRPYDEY